MNIPSYVKANFDTLLRAAATGHLALLQGRDASTGKDRYVLCAIGRDGNDLVFTPFGHLDTDNPYETYEWPQDLEVIHDDRGNEDAPE